MDLLSTIRKEGSRGGVNFSWSDVSTSQHRENYLGHSLMAPVGRWQKGRDLGWYAKGDDKTVVDGETDEERRVRERKEEIRRIKEAEEDALARALGLPVPDRGTGTGANGITVGEVNRAVKEVGVGDEVEGEERGKGFGGFVGKTLEEEVADRDIKDHSVGGLVKKDREVERLGKRREGRSRSPSRERQRRRHRRRSRSGERRRHRSRSGERYRHRRRNDDREERRPRSRSLDKRERRHRSRSADVYKGKAYRGEHRVNPDRPRRIRSPEPRNRDGRRW